MSFFFIAHGAHLVLHSFPTRRSSDLQKMRNVVSRTNVDHAWARARVRQVAAPGTTLRPSAPAWIYQLVQPLDRKSTRLNSSHQIISYAVFCLKKKNHNKKQTIIAEKL